MFRRCAGKLEPYGLSTGRPVFKAEREGFFRRRWRIFSERTPLGKAASVTKLSFGLIGGYLALSISIQACHQPTVDSLFHPQEDYTLADWALVEPTLREGDIIMMKGTGFLSYAIAGAQFACSWLRPSALRYSHVAVVVEPAVVVDPRAPKGRSLSSSSFSSVDGLSQSTKYPNAPPSAAKNENSRSWWHWRSGGSSSSTGGAARVKEVLGKEDEYLSKRPYISRGAIILEAMDNSGFDVPDIHGKYVYNAVQRVEATKRLCSATAEGEKAYAYFSVRRLKGLDVTPEVKKTITQFCEENEGRSMDCSWLCVVSYIYLPAYKFLRPERFARREVSCSELIMELYQKLGIVRRRWRWVPLEGERLENFLRIRGNRTTAAMRLVNGPAPFPTDADILNIDTNAMHVYDLFYGRADLAPRWPTSARGVPCLENYSVIEGGKNMRAESIRKRSLVSPVTLRAERALRKEQAKHSEDAASIAANSGETEEAALEIDDHTPRLVAGMVAEDNDDNFCQLQWYYKHNSLCTSPSDFTEILEKNVFDWAPGYGLGEEIFMQVPPQEGVSILGMLNGQD